MTRTMKHIDDVTKAQMLRALYDLECEADDIRAEKGRHSDDYKISSGRAAGARTIIEAAGLTGDYKNYFRWMKGLPLIRCTIYDAYGKEVDTYTTREDAEQAVREFEAAAMKDGTYFEDMFEIKEGEQ